MRERATVTCHHNALCFCTALNKTGVQTTEVETVFVTFISGFPGPIKTSGMEQVQYKYVSN